MSTRSQTPHAASPGDMPALSDAPFNRDAAARPSAPRPWHRRARSLGGSVALVLAAVTVIAGCSVPDGSATDAPNQDDDPTPVAEADADVENDEDGDAATAPEPEPATATAATEPAEESTEDAAEEPSEELTTEPVVAEPQHFTGTGADVVMLEPLRDTSVYAEVTHDGGGNFALWSVDDNGQNLELLVNTIDGYTGAVPINFSEDPSALRIEADGSWDIQFRPLHEAPRWDGSGTYEAEGDALVIVDGVADGLTPVTLTHTGDRNFAIWAWGDDSRDLIVNEIGTYDGTTLLPDGSLVLQVTADGAWSLTKE